MHTVQPTFMLIRSTHVGWTGLRLVLQEVSGVRVISQEQQPQEAVSSASRLQPDIIFTAARVNGASSVGLIADLNRCCPASKVLVVLESQQPEEMEALVDANVAGYLPWEAFRPETVPHILAV